MKEASWDDCVACGSARKISADVKRAESLIETAHERIAIIEKITERNCNFVFEDYYTSVLELLQAITFKQGYNVANHVCLGFYVRDMLERDDLYRIFDDIRYKRNSLTYYGIRMDFETAIQAVEKCKKMINELKEYD